MKPYFNCRNCSFADLHNPLFLQSLPPSLSYKDHQLIVVQVPSMTFMSSSLFTFGPIVFSESLTTLAKLSTFRCTFIQDSNAINLLHCSIKNLSFV